MQTSGCLYAIAFSPLDGFRVEILFSQSILQTASRDKFDLLVVAAGNQTGFANQHYDTACQGALISLLGTPENEHFHKEAQRILAEQLPMIPLYLRLNVAATRPDMQGFRMDPTARSEFWNIEAFDYGE